jgi:hypothetical protein
VISGSVSRAGVRTVTVTASSSSGSNGSIQFSWAVERRPHVSTALAHPGAAPALTVTARSGAYEPALRQLIIALPHSITLAHSARSLQVLSPSGQPLAHSAHFAGHVLTIKLSVAQTPVRVVFPSGSLRVSGTVKGARSFVIRTVDRLGGEITLHRVLASA